MPKQQTITVYSFDELDEKAKEKARDWWLSSAQDEYQFAFEDTLEDAKNIGLLIHTLDDHRQNEGKFITSAPECAEKIVADHGKDCETRKTAAAYLSKLEELGEASEDAEDELRDAWNEKKEFLDEEFLRAILEDYRIIYSKDCEYRTSRENVDESIRINEYEFLETGKRA